MNIYYAPPSQIHRRVAELLGQEARHAAKVMRVREGDTLTIVDGEGGRYEGPVRRITKKSVQVEITSRQQVAAPVPELILGMGIIKKRDRLEFAVEKAVELGARHIVLFRSERTIKENVRMDRLEAIVQSAMKQSLRSWLPTLSLAHSAIEVIRRYNRARCLVAHEKVDKSAVSFSTEGAEQQLLMIGPEGGFSPQEIEQAVEAGAELVSLGSYRLRAETAAIAFLSRFLR